MTLTAPFPISMAVGDVDNDGDLDVVIADSVSSDIVVLLGNGAGALAPQPRFTGLSASTALVLTDLDSNGILDLATASAGFAGLSVFTGDGNGSLGGRKDFLTANTVFALAAGDYDNDGRPDLAGSSVATDQALLFVNAYDPVCAKPSFARAGRLQVPLGGGNPGRSG